VIEQVMIFALGVLVAGLLGLMFLPAFWRRAVRLSARRIEMQLPLSMSEIVAERDLLRAEFAVVQRRLEQRMEKLGDARASDMSELGRKSLLVAKQAGELSEVRTDMARLEASLAQAQADGVDARAQLGAALNEVYDSSRLRERNVVVSSHAESLQHLAEERRLIVAGLETRIAGLDLRVGDLQGELASHEKALLAKHSVLERLTEERDRARADAATHAAKIATLHRNLEERDRKISAIDDALADMARSRAALERQLQESRRGEEDRAAREPETRSIFDRQLEAARKNERKLIGDIEALRAEKGALQGALETLRAEFSGRDRMRRRIGAVAGDKDADSETKLRNSISDLGAEVLRIAAALEGDEAPRGPRPVPSPAQDNLLADKPEKRTLVSPAGSSAP
jgi:chromosome segregation ATPase